MILNSEWAVLAAVGAAAGIGGVTAGVLVAGSSVASRWTISASAGLLLGVAIFGLLPELAHDSGWLGTLACYAIGFALLTVLDRMGVAICPDCAEEHGHDGCPAPLHGFAPPLLIAAGAHSLLDGWAIGASAVTTGTGIRWALPLAIILHKIPEGVSLGAISESALRSRSAAWLSASVVEALTLAGAAAGAFGAERWGSFWTIYPLAIAGGFFVFLATHAWRAQWRRNPRPAFAAGTAGLAIAMALQAGVRLFLSRAT